MIISQLHLGVVSSSLQLGKGGIKLVNSSNTLAVQLSNGTLTNVQIADPTISSHSATKNYVDTMVPGVFNASGSQLQNVKRIVIQTTTNSSGAWSVTLPSLGLSQILNVNATAISGSSASPPTVDIAHVKQYSSTQVSGVVTTGTGMLLGGNSLVAAGSGVVVFVEVLVQ